MEYNLVVILCKVLISLHIFHQYINNLLKYYEKEMCLVIKLNV